MALSPTVRLRSMGGDVDALAQSLSNCQMRVSEPHGSSVPPVLGVEVQIAALKGQLENVGVRSHPISDVEAWHDYFPMIRAWVASGDLETARWYQPGITAITDCRRTK